MQCALVDCRAHPHAIGLLVVGREVLERRTDVDALHAAHPCFAECRRQERILGVVLEVAAAERGAFEVDAGAENDRDLAGECLGADGLADAVGKVGVPGLGESDSGRKAGRGNALRQAERVGGALLFAQSARAVGHCDRRQVALGLGLPEVLAAGESGLLCGGQRRCSHRYSSVRRLGPPLSTVADPSSEAVRVRGRSARLWM